MGSHGQKRGRKADTLTKHPPGQAAYLSGTRGRQAWVGGLVISNSYIQKSCCHLQDTSTDVLRLGQSGALQPGLKFKVASLIDDSVVEAFFTYAQMGQGEKITEEMSPVCTG